MSSSYHESRLSEDPKRDVLWGVLSDYLQRFVAPNSRVLDFGAGYCDFVNKITAKEKYAYDIWDGINEYAHDGVHTIIGDTDSFGKLDNGVESQSLDIIFGSNIFEHFTVSDLESLFPLLHKKLDVGGRLIIVQPNFCYAFRNYFDDYTHKSIWTHVSLTDFLDVQGFRPVAVEPKFMPLTVKSRLPVHPLLIRAYLMSPIKPMAGQMLIVAEKKS